MWLARALGKDLSVNTGRRLFKKDASGLITIILKSSAQWKGEEPGRTTGWRKGGGPPDLGRTGLWPHDFFRPNGGSGSNNLCDCEGIKKKKEGRK